MYKIFEVIYIWNEISQKHDNKKICNINERFEIKLSEMNFETLKTQYTKVFGWNEVIWNERSHYPMHDFDKYKWRSR